MPRHSASPMPEQQADLERPDAAEIRRPPFHDQRQRAAEREDLFRRQQRIPAIGRAAAATSAATRMPPSAAPAIFATQPRRPHRIERDRRDQHQAEHKTAMQIGPQRHQRQQPERRRVAPIGGRDQSADPCHHDRHRQHMRPRQQMRHRQRQRRGDEHHRGAFAQMPVQEFREQREGDARSRRPTAPPARSSRTAHRPWRRAPAPATASKSRAGRAW